MAFCSRDDSVSMSFCTARVPCVLRATSTSAPGAAADRWSTYSDPEASSGRQGKMERAAGGRVVGKDCCAPFILGPLQTFHPSMALHFQSPVMTCTHTAHS
jgi:hypothetical protein